MFLRDSIAAAAIFAFSVAAFVLAGSFAAGADLFPRAISGVMIVVSLLLFVRTLARPRRDEDPALDWDVKRLLIAIVLTIAYVALLVPIGFIVASLVYVPAAAYALGYTRHRTIWITTLIVVGGAYVLFERIFHTPLPEGPILPLVLGS